MTATIWGAVALVGALFGVILAIFKVGVDSERDANDAAVAQANLDAERKRTALDDEIQQDTDLAARARASGLVRGAER